MAKYEALQRLIEKGYSVPKIHFKIDDLKSWLEKNMEDLGQINQIKSSKLILRSNHEDEDSSLSQAGVYTSYRIEKGNNKLLREQLNKIASEDKNKSFFIQDWIEFDISGVCFTRNPNNLWDKDGLIEFSSQAEAVTSGSLKNKILKFSNAKDEQLRNLINICKKLEYDFGCPLDIEWGFQQGRVWLVQARPIWSDGHDNQFYESQWTRESADERFPLAMTPLGWDLMENAMPENLKQLESKMGIKASSSLPTTLYKNFVYVNPTYFKFENLKISWAWVLRKGIFLKLIFFTVKIPWLLLQKKSIPFSFFYMLYGNATKKLIQEWPKILESTLSDLKKIEKNIESISINEKLFNDLEKCCFLFFRDDILVYALKSAHYSLIKKQKSDADIHMMIENLNHPRLAFQNEMLDSKKSLEGLISKYGHLRMDWDISRPDFSENPNLLESLRTNGSPFDKNNKIDLKNIGFEKKPDEEKNFVSLVLIDEEMQFYSSMFVKVCKKFMHRLAMQENIEKEFIYFYRLKEIKNLIHTKKKLPLHILEQRRKNFELAQKEIPPYKLPPLAKTALTFSENVNFTAVSQGQAEGPLYVLETMEQLSSAPANCILYFHFPHPLLITVFPKINGLICRQGGPLAHGFISAREYRLPAIISHYDFNISMNGKKVRIFSESGQFEWV